MKKILVLGALALVGCSPKTTVQIWEDNQGNAVPVNVSFDGNDTVYDFGTIILYPDTTYGGDTIK